MQECDIVYEEQLIAVVQEIHPASTFEQIRLPYTRCAAKSVKKPAVLPMFSDLEIGKVLRFRHEHSFHLTVVCPKINLTLDSAAHTSTIVYLKDAPQFRRKGAVHHEPVILQSLFQFRGVWVNRVRRGKQE
jgi:hypothetical protein